jgi:uncharacterized protein YkwD
MRTVAAFAILAVLAACDQPAQTTSSPSANAAPVAAVSTGGDAGLTALINNFRASQGMGPVVAVPSLTRAAQSHVQDMVANGYFSHSSRNGASVGDRVKANGCDWTGVSENIAQGQTSPEQAMQSWINSPGHRRNLLGPYTQIGPARAGNTWVLVLATGC